MGAGAVCLCVCVDAGMSPLPSLGGIPGGLDILNTERL